MTTMRRADAPRWLERELTADEVRAHAVAHPAEPYHGMVCGLWIRVNEEGRPEFVRLTVPDHGHVTCIERSLNRVLRWRPVTRGGLAADEQRRISNLENQIDVAAEQDGEIRAVVGARPDEITAIAVRRAMAERDAQIGRLKSQLFAERERHAMSAEEMRVVLVHIFARNDALLAAWLPLVWVVGADQVERALWWAGPSRDRLHDARLYLLEGRQVQDDGSWPLPKPFDAAAACAALKTAVV